MATLRVLYVKDQKDICVKSQADLIDSAGLLYALGEYRQIPVHVNGTVKQELNVPCAGGDPGHALKILVGIMNKHQGAGPNERPFAEGDIIELENEVTEYAFVYTRQGFVLLPVLYHALGITLKLLENGDVEPRVANRILGATVRLLREQEMNTSR